MNDLSLDPDNLFIICHIDHDGLAGAHVVRQKYPTGVIIPTNYYKPFPRNQIPKGATVVIVDFSYKLAVMREIVQDYYVVWLDHHKSALEEITQAGIPYEGVDPKWCPEENSGAELAWRWCYGDDPMPDAIKWIGDYDRWAFDHNESLPFYYGLGILQLYPGKQSAPTWEKLLYGESDMLSNILSKGGAIHKFVTARDKAVMEDIAYSASLDIPVDNPDGTQERGFTKALIANVRGINSFFFEAHPKKNDYDVCISYGWVPKIGKYRCSIYQINPNVDVSQIAMKYGGGGHAGAAGWSCLKFPWAIPQCPHPGEGKNDDHMWEAFKLTNNNAVRLFMTQSDKIGVNSLIKHANLGEWSAKFVNCPYTWGNIWFSSDTTGADLGVAYTLTNNGNYRMVITNLSSVDMEKVAALVGGVVHDGESVWVYLPITNPWLELPIDVDIDLIPF